MADRAATLGARKTAMLLVLVIPSVDHRSKPLQPASWIAGRAARGVKGMAKQIKKITKLLGTKPISEIPETGGARSAPPVWAMLCRPSNRGCGRVRQAPGRPSDPLWVRLRKCR